MQILRILFSIQFHLCGSFFSLSAVWCAHAIDCFAWIGLRKRYFILSTINAKAHTFRIANWHFNCTIMQTNEPIDERINCSSYSLEIVFFRLFFFKFLFELREFNFNGILRSHSALHQLGKTSRSFILDLVNVN